MKFKIGFIYFGFIAVFLLSCGSQNGGGSSNSGKGPKIIDHTYVNADIIPDSIIAEIKQLKVYFEHASVGGNVASGLNLLSSNPRYNVNRQTIHDDNSGPLSTTWVDSNSGFLDNDRGNPGLSAKVSRFYDRLSAGNFANHVDVAMFKFCWIDDSGIAGNAQAEFDSVRTTMENLEGLYPSTVFVWWTMPITTQIPANVVANTKRDNYNKLVRQYCAANNKFLLDIADIECHTPSGATLIDANGNYYLEGSYASDEGHLNDTGSTRVANAWWILLAGICGWNP